MIVRQVIATGLAFIYTVVLAGIPVNIHFCRGDVVSIGVLQSGEEYCCHNEAEVPGCCADALYGQTCSPEGANECCYDAQFSIQYLEDEQLTKSKTTSFSQGNDQVSNPPVQICLTEDTDSYEHSGLYDLPPPKPRPLWLLHCTLTFYG